MDNERLTNSVYKIWLSLTAKEDARGYQSLSAAERVYWCVYLLDMEIYNGGFDQYYINSSGDYASGVVAALRAIGAHKAARITEDAFSYVFPGGIVPEDRDERWTQAEAVEERDPQYDERTNVFSRQYCKDEDEIYTLLEQYARLHNFVVD